MHHNSIPELLGKGGPHEEFSKQRQLIGINYRQPELAHAIVANNVAGFHASNSSSLIGVLKHGLLSSHDSRQRGIALGSGERTYTSPKNRPFISFADWHDADTLRRYSGPENPRTLDSYLNDKQELVQAVDKIASQWGEDHLFTINGRLQIIDYERVIDTIASQPDSHQSELIMANFPVLYGFDVTSYDRVSSDYCIDKATTHPLLLECLARTSVNSEFAVINGSVPPSDIPVIAVPEHHVEETRQLVQQAGRGIDVYPIDPLIVSHQTL